MKISNMEDETKIKHAEYLLKFSCNLNTAFFVTILITPLGLISSQLVGSSPNYSVMSIINTLDIMGSWQGITFLTLEALVFFLACSSQNKALEIYNELHKPKPNKMPKLFPLRCIATGPTHRPGFCLHRNYKPKGCKN